MNADTLNTYPKRIVALLYAFEVAERIAKASKLARAEVPYAWLAAQMQVDETQTFQRVLAAKRAGLVAPVTTNAGGRGKRTRFMLTATGRAATGVDASDAK